MASWPAACSVWGAPLWWAASSSSWPERAGSRVDRCSAGSFLVREHRLCGEDVVGWIGPVPPGAGGDHALARPPPRLLP
jgi:hypothetical protein